MIRLKFKDKKKKNNNTYQAQIMLNQYQFQQPHTDPHPHQNKQEFTLLSIKQLQLLNDSGSKKSTYPKHMLQQMSSIKHQHNQYIKHSKNRLKLLMNRNSHRENLLQKQELMRKCKTLQNSVQLKEQNSSIKKVRLQPIQNKTKIIQEFRNREKKSKNHIYKYPIFRSLQQLKQLQPQTHHTHTHDHSLLNQPKEVKPKKIKIVNSNRNINNNSDHDDVVSRYLKGPSPWNIQGRTQQQIQQYI